MVVDYMLDDRQLPDQYRVVRDQVQLSRAKCDVVGLMGSIVDVGVHHSIWPLCGGMTGQSAPTSPIGLSERLS